MKTLVLKAKTEGKFEREITHILLEMFYKWLMWKVLEGVTKFKIFEELQGQEIVESRKRKIPEGTVHIEEH